MNTEEGVHNLPDGSELYTKTWKTSGSPRAILAFIHGFSDHCNAYGELFPTLASAGIEVRSFDQRGWGRSVKQPHDRGNTGPTSQVLADMHSFLQTLPSQSAPLFLMGHSMGGGQTLNYIFHPDSPYNKDKTSRPGFAGYTPLEATLLSRDEAVCRDFVADTLCHDMGTFEGLAGMLDRGIWLEGMFGGSAGGWVESELPFWFGHGTGDRITAFSATKVFVEGLKAKGGDVQFCAYENAYHKLHAELPETTEKFFADVKTWVLERVPGMEGEVEPRVKL
ncbi:hypothetical protein N7461_006947 [Penicillium sp. DV-2018c]|nr:hypothetical protein N7461_006947 [Penicillium sp. DV-2018c]